MIGQRIQLARKKSGYSLRGLAEAMGHLVTAQAIGKYERGESVPNSRVLIALAKTLGVSVPFLMDSNSLEIEGVEFRTKAKTKKQDIARVEAEVIEWAERYIQIERILEMESATWSAPLSRLRKLASPEESERLAEEVRDRWNLGGDPISNMTELLEEKGLKVLIVDLPKGVSGLTSLIRMKSERQGAPVIVVNQSFPLERRRLTLAHELAHRLIDSTCLPPRALEKAANRFAGAFLIPGKHLRSELGERRRSLGVRELIVMKRLYRVSAAALLVRLRDLEVIADNTMEYAFRTYAKTWRTEEPKPIEGKDRESHLEPARRFERLCYRALAERFISKVKAAELLRCSVDDVEVGLRGLQAQHADHR